MLLPTTTLAPQEGDLGAINNPQFAASASCPSVRDKLHLVLPGDVGCAVLRMQGKPVVICALWGLFTGVLNF